MPDSVKVVAAKATIGGLTVDVVLIDGDDLWAVRHGDAGYPVQGYANAIAATDELAAQVSKVKSAQQVVAVANDELLTFAYVKQQEFETTKDPGAVVNPPVLSDGSVPTVDGAATVAASPVLPG